MPGSGGVEPKGAIPEKGKNVGLSIMGYRFAPGSTFLHSHPRRLQRVTANYVLATAGAHLSSACHCEPVRTLVRQSVSLASWLLFRQRMAFRQAFVYAVSVIRFRYRFLPCSNCKEYGLPRRSAPRNDRGEQSYGLSHRSTPHNGRGKYPTALRRAMTCKRQLRVTQFTMTSIHLPGLRIPPQEHIPRG